MSQITLLTGERRRTWTDEQKLAILDEAFGGSAVVADVARRHEISTGLLYTWRRNVLAARDESGFVPAVVVESGAAPGPAASLDPAIVVELPHGARVTFSTDTPAALVTATLRALR